jgi:hypothetical protein
MVISPGSAVSADFASLFSRPHTASADATNSFARQLASMLAGYLGQSGDSANLQPHFEIDVQAAPEQTSGARQFLVTVRDPGTAPATATASMAAPATAPAAVSTIPRPPASELPPPTPPPPPDGVKRLANGRPVLNSADAYWFTQPPPVQALQNMNSEDARSNLAHELADQGYLIDVPIMVWGWDPLSTMIVRRNEGFTWIPSAKMDPVQVAPGLKFGGLPSYNPVDPPQGSIPVTTDWAKGLESTGGWLHPGDY